MKSYLFVAGKTRTEAIANFRTVPLPKRRELRDTHSGGLTFVDARQYTHTMAWSVVEEDGGFKRALTGEHHDA